tara:strand:- start:4912 stop:5244 length:333 start_codon:yes stop_codon:yes gene_type:complete
MTVKIYAQLDTDNTTVIEKVTCPNLSTDAKCKDHLERATGIPAARWIDATDAPHCGSNSEWTGTFFKPVKTYPSWVYNADTNTWESPIGNPDNLDKSFWNEDDGVWHDVP